MFQTQFKCFVPVPKRLKSGTPIIFRPYSTTPVGGSLSQRFESDFGRFSVYFDWILLLVSKFLAILASFFSFPVYFSAF